MRCRADHCEQPHVAGASAVLPGRKRGRGRARVAGEVGHARRAEPVQPIKLYAFQAARVAGPRSADIATHVYICRYHVNARVCSSGPFMQLLASSWHVSDFLIGLPFSA